MNHKAFGASRTELTVKMAVVLCKCGCSEVAEIFGWRFGGRFGGRLAGFTKGLSGAGIIDR